MDRVTRSKYISIFSGLATGTFLIFEGSGVTNFADNSGSTPEWVIAILGTVFFTAGVMVYIGAKGHINHLFASIVLALMGITFGWLALFGMQDDSTGGASIGIFTISIGGDALLKRYFFAIDSVILFLVSSSAFRMYAKERPNK